MDEEFVRATRRAIEDIYAVILKLTTRELCLRAAFLTLVEQPGINHERLAEDFDANLLRILEQVPPHLRDDQVIADFAAELQDRLVLHPGRMRPDED